MQTNLVKSYLNSVYCLRKNVLFLSLSIMLFAVACQTTKKTSTTVNSSTTASGFYTKYSKKLGVTLAGTEDTAFIKAITKWIGVPYVYGGESKTGTDCSGMVQTIFKEVYNINLKRTAYDQVKDCDRIAKKNLRSRDLVFFKINNKKVSHVGIYIANGKFIHASLKGVVVSDLKETYYATYFYSGGRIKKLE